MTFILRSREGAKLLQDLNLVTMSFLLFIGTSMHSEAVGQNAYGEWLEERSAVERHPFQALTLAGTVIGLPNRDLILRFPLNLIWNEDDEVCSEFSVILEGGLEPFIISTASTHLGRGFYTLPWLPQIEPATTGDISPPSETVLHHSAWLSSYDRINFAYRVFTVSGVPRGRLFSCRDIHDQCHADTIGNEGYMLFSVFPEFNAPRSVSGETIHLLGPSLFYNDRESSALEFNDLERYMRGRWFYQFLNMVRWQDRLFLISFRPNDLWNVEPVPGERGVLIWDITDASEDTHAICWFSELDTRLPN